MGTALYPSSGSWSSASARGHVFEEFRVAVSADKPDMNDEKKKPSWTYTAVALGILLAAIVGLRVTNAVFDRVGSEPYVRDFMIFNTYARLTFWEPERDAAAAADGMIHELAQLQAVINTYEPASEISKLNATAHDVPFECSDRLWEILHASRQAYKVSDGSFDISVGPLMKLWGFYSKRHQMPSDEEIRQARELVGLDKVEFDSSRQTVSFSREGMFLDFGGIAKGYALDMCKSIADEHGLSRGMIDLGGNIACLDEPPPRAAGLRCRHQKPGPD